MFSVLAQLWSETVVDRVTGTEKVSVGVVACGYSIGCGIKISHMIYTGTVVGTEGALVIIGGSISTAISHGDNSSVTFAAVFSDC